MLGIVLASVLGDPVAAAGMQILTAILLAFCNETIYPWVKQSSVSSTESTENIAWGGACEGVEKRYV